MKKTDVLGIKSIERLSVRIHIEGKQEKQVGEFKNLGNTVKKIR